MIEQSASGLPEVRRPLPARGEALSLN
jgi:hypothetical protein